MPVETIVYQNQQDYYRTLAEADRANNSTVFIEFMLDMILITLQTYNEDGISGKVSDKVSGKLSGKQQEIYHLICRYLQTHPDISNGQLQALTGKSAATVRKYLAELVAAGVLEAEGENKKRVYRLAGEEKAQIESF